MRPYGVIFDMDGVLVDSYAAHLKSWQLLAQEIGVAVTKDQFAETFGRTSRDIIEALFDVSESKTIRRYDARKEALYRDLIRGQVPAMPGAKDLVRELYTAGFRLAVGSSGPPENIALVSTEMGLDRYITVQVTGADVERGKPDPQVFLLASERMGILSQQCIVIEDAPSGIEAAHRAGMHCIALASSHEAKALSQADEVVQRLDEINVDLIDALLSHGGKSITQRDRTQSAD